MADDLLVEVQDGIGILTLNRPEKYNAFTSAMLWALVAALDDFETRDDVQVVILTGAGKGFCSGGDIGGMDLALACYIRVASTRARFSETYGKIGLAPGGGGGYFLPRIVGKAHALEMLWTADFMDAETALSIGLVNHVYADEDLMAETIKLAKKIAGKPPLSVSLIKRLVDQSLRSDMDTAFDLVSSHIAILRSGPDHKEAIAAFK